VHCHDTLLGPDLAVGVNDENGSPLMADDHD
jgi:hypothetical protein